MRKKRTGIYNRKVRWADYQGIIDNETGHQVGQLLDLGNNRLRTFMGNLLVEAWNAGVTEIKPKRRKGGK